MIKYLFILTLLASSFAFGQSFTKVSNTASVKSKINAKAKSTTSISADFTEEVYSSMFNSAKKATGELNYKQSNKIRWEHISPKKQTILINGSKVQMKENGKIVDNVASNRIVKKVQGMMMQLFNGDFLNEKEFTIGYYESSSQYKLVLKPKSSRMSKYISSIEMIFNKKNLELSQMNMIETEDDRVEYKFTSVVMNKAIADTKFTQF
jgi:outer membrane lipoprotein-sorting protein